MKWLPAPFTRVRFAPMPPYPERLKFMQFMQSTQDRVKLGSGRRGVPVAKSIRRTERDAYRCGEMTRLRTTGRG